MKIINEDNSKLKFKTQDLRDEIEDFLIANNVPSEIIYHIKNQLSIQTNMPYYKDKSKGKRNKLNKLLIIFEISKVLMTYNNSSFTRKLMSELAKNQNQALRGLSKKLKSDINRKSKFPNGIWEHIIPIKYIRDTIINYINNKNMLELEEFLFWVENNTFQAYLTKEEDIKVNSLYKDNMPLDWDWKTGDIFIRYKDAGIRKDLYS